MAASAKSVQQSYPTTNALELVKDTRLGDLFHMGDGFYRSMFSNLYHKLVTTEFEETQTTTDYVNFNEDNFDEDLPEPPIELSIGFLPFPIHTECKPIIINKDTGEIIKINEYNDTEGCLKGSKGPYDFIRLFVDITDILSILRGSVLLYLNFKLFPTFF
jgi:hypothetical protein